MMFKAWPKSKLSLRGGNTTTDSIGSPGSSWKGPDPRLDVTGADIPLSDDPVDDGDASGEGVADGDVGVSRLPEQLAMRKAPATKTSAASRLCMGTSARIR